MPVDLYPKESLINAALMTERPVAFLVGSPLSLHDGTGVPGIATMLDLVREEIRKLRAAALPQFDMALSGRSGAEAYQAAMKWLGVNAGQDAVNHVVRKAVLRARRPTAGELPSGSDGEPDDWDIPAGSTALTELVTRGGDRFLGPVLTTNFDPLISLGILKSGGHPGRRVLTSDGTLAGTVEDERGVCSVVHLHGFWRDSDTLHTQAQLTNPRPKLKASLQRLLVVQRRTLIVAAYGGWDDVFTQALVELMNDEQAQLDVIWCFYENDPGLVEKRYGKLLHAMNSATLLNRFRPFGGIDCHSIFTEILSNLRGMSSPVIINSTVSSPMAGWEYIDSTYLSSLSELTPDQIVRYFDGAVPTWQHATSVAIPRRQVVAEVTENLTKFAKDDARSMQLIRAAGGEGKSTLLLQAAADMAQAGGWSVLWRSSPKEGISPDQIAHLDSTRRWLIVADDADNIVKGLADCANHLSQSGQSGVHFLLAARDADWMNARGPQQPWAKWVTFLPDIILRGISSADARAVVTAWEQLGNSGLRQLEFITDTAQRVAALESAIRDARDEQVERMRKHQQEDGSFFGGLLAVRFGQNGLQAHVRDFLQRLLDVRVEYRKSTLFDALLYVAACHDMGIPGIDERVLADLVGVPREWVQRQVVRPLGEEAAAVHNAGHVLTRHSRVAAAILVEAEQTFGIDLAEVWSQLVRQTVQTSRDGRVSYETHARIIHAGPRLQNALPSQISVDRRTRIAIAAARAATRYKSEWLGCVVDLGKTYRYAEKPKEAVAVFRENLESASSKVDHDQVIRGYWNEWGVCEGLASNPNEHRGANAWIQGLSLSDYLNPAPITSEQGKLSCAGLGVAFGTLAQPASDCPYAKARRAISFLGRRFGSDSRALLYFNRHDREADKLKTPHPQNVHEAIAWLTSGVAQAGRELQDSFLEDLLKPDQVSFKMLENVISPDQTPTALPPYSVKPSTKTVPTLSSAELLKRFRPHQDPVQVGIDRVVDEAWKAVPPDIEPEKRFQLAILKAKQSISRLSPHIKRQVGAHFQTQGWEPLKSREPQH